jgi:hypothetical protein
MINHRIVGPRTNMYLEHPEKNPNLGEYTRYEEYGKTEGILLL